MIHAYYRRSKRKIDNQQNPPQTIDKYGTRSASYQQLIREQIVQATFLEALEGMAHMNKIGLHVPLDPARTLA